MIGDSSCLRRSLWVVLLAVASCADEAAPAAEPLGPPQLPALGPRPELQRCVLIAPGSDEPPASIADTGCFELPGQTPAADLIPYAVRSPLWSDHAVKDRYFVIPPGDQLIFTEEGPWEFGSGAILVKNFSLEVEPGQLRLIETRFMLLDEQGSWRFYTYKWNTEGSDATLLQGFESVTVPLADGSELTYDFPSEEGCEACHSELALGPRTEQLNMEVSYDGELANQLDALAAFGLFGSSYEGPPERLAALPIPADEHAPLEDRARSYLHANCAHCHRPGGWAPQEMDLDLRLSTPLSEAQLCGVAVQISPVGPEDLRLSPGDPQASAIFTRMQRLDDARMAPIGTRLVDPMIDETVGPWIEQLTSCP